MKMLRLNALAALLAMTVVCVGCGQSSQPPATTAAKLPEHPAAQVIYQFLEAVRQHRPESAQFLSPTALKHTQELDFVFAPAASPTAGFKVVGVNPGEQPSETYVLTYWSDLDADGQRIEDEIAWKVNDVEGQWRITGMVFQPDPEVDQLEAINFEDRESLARAARDISAPQSPSDNPAAPLPTDKVARDPFQQPAQR